MTARRVHKLIIMVIIEVITIVIIMVIIEVIMIAVQIKSSYSLNS